MEYEILYHDGFFEVTTHGDAELGPMTEYLPSIVAHEKWRPGTSILANHSDLNAGPLTVNEVRQLAEGFVKLRTQLGQAKAAVVTAGDMEFGMARMWGAFVDGKSDVIARIFRSRDEAIIWLEDV